MKRAVGVLDAKPSKRLFHSIIADYDLNRSICELVDNGLDVWVRGGRSAKISIDVTLDEAQQVIFVGDNAGGLPKAELQYVVGPGQSGSDPSEETIGFFGVGTKRAVVALSQDIKITTRHGIEKTYRVEFDDTWLNNDDWSLPFYEADDLPPGNTLVELHRLRSPITGESISQLHDHLGATYAKFVVNSEVTIKLNGVPVEPILFDNWAYPPGFEPRRYHGNLPDSDGRLIRVEALAGLSNESSPASGEYGVYFYCNDRLVARALKSFEVGFMKGYAGLPHPKVSLTKILVFLNGDAGAMPWNSSKSDISSKSAVFQALHPWLMQVVKDYAALSRIWMGEWPDKVFRYDKGNIVDVPVSDFPTVRKSYLPPMPKSRPRYGDVISQANQKIADSKPWVKGLYEGMIAADLVSKQHLEQKNRISTILIDSTLEIAFKEYLVNEAEEYYSDKQLLEIFGTRHKLESELKRHTSFPDEIWKQIHHLSDLRNSLIHRRATATVSDGDLLIYRRLAEAILKRLYDLKFEPA